MMNSKITMSIEPEYEENLLASELAEFLVKLPEDTPVIFRNQEKVHSLEYDSGRGTVEIW
jgi:hypothetical protein